MSVLLGQQILANNFIFLLVWPEIYLICLDISLAMDIRYEDTTWARQCDIGKEAWPLASNVKILYRPTITDIYILSWLTYL